MNLFIRSASFPHYQAIFPVNRMLSHFPIILPSFCFVHKQEAIGAIFYTLCRFFCTALSFPGSLLPEM